MKRPWAFICANEGVTSKHLRNYCREVYLLGYLPVCPKLQDSQYLVLEDAVERSEYTAIVRDKLLRCPMLVVCSRNQDATTNAQIGLAQKYKQIPINHRHGHRQCRQILPARHRAVAKPVPCSAFSFGKYLIGLLVFGNQALGDFENVLVFSLLLVLDLAELH